MAGGCLKERGKATVLFNDINGVHISEDDGRGYWLQRWEQVGKSLRKAGKSSESQYTAVMGKGRRWDN